jgi:hypothetical protein
VSRTVAYADVVVVVVFVVEAVVHDCGSMIYVATSPLPPPPPLPPREVTTMY